MIEKIATPKKTIEIIKEYEFAFKKRFGQNFLIDSNILEKIVRSAEVTKDDVVIEIGPGIGGLTQVLAEYAKKVIAIEIDNKLIPILENVLAEYKNIIIYNNDILKMDMNALIQEHHEGKPIKIIANLPYYITTPIIMGIFENKIPVDSITVMVQKEVADRMQAKPGTKDYGALSIAVQYYSEPSIIANVGPNCFIPAPKVGSSVIQLKKHTHPLLDDVTEKVLFQLVRASFNQRRKTLVNTLLNSDLFEIKKEIIIEALHQIKLDERIRGEALTLNQFIELAQQLKA